MVPSVARLCDGDRLEFFGVPAMPHRDSLFARFLIYQRERFPLLRYAPLVLVFTGSASTYSRLVRGAPGFVRWEVFLTGAWTALALFFLLRVLDEHKDARTDAAFRSELPVPRGLISLSELRSLAGGALGAAFILNALVAPRLLWALGATLLWLALMGREFFIAGWLRRHPTAYMLTHMAVMPMIDSYTTGLDWLAEGDHPRTGLWLFLAITYLNGMVLEIGRKIRAPEQEREGVETYTRAWGLGGAPIVWLGVLLATAAAATIAGGLTGAGWVGPAFVLALLTVTALPGLAFRRSPTPANAHRLDTAGGIWTLGMYLVLAIGPFAARWLGP